MASNSKPAAELRIGAVKATVWENEVGDITRHNVTFSRIYRDEDQWKTTHSFAFKEPADPRQARRSGRTRSLPSATPRPPRRWRRKPSPWARRPTTETPGKRPHLPAAGSPPSPF